MIPLPILNLYGAYIVGGTDAGQRINLFYPDSRAVFPILPEGKEVLPDTPASSWGLAWYLGLNQLGQPKFQVRDDVVLNSKIAWHEAGHALEDVIIHRKATETGVSPEDALDEVRTRYWAWRGFPGTWLDAIARANAQVGVGAGWPYFPGESVAESISAATGGYVQSEWTQTYGKDLALTWWVPPGNGYDPSGGGMRMRDFWQGLMREVDMDEATVRQIAAAAATEAVARAGLDPNTVQVIKNDLAKDAHHKHGVLTSSGQATDMSTTEPLAQ